MKFPSKNSYSFIGKFLMGGMQEILKTVNRRLYPQKLFYSPSWIILGVNNVCNLHCKMCDVGTDYARSNFFSNMVGNHPLNMPPELVREIVDQTANYFSGTKIGFSFTEPIIYPYLVESVAYASSKGIRTQMTTNGSKLSKLAADLQKAGMQDITVSIDGPPEIHNYIRGHHRAFEWAYEGLEAIASLHGKKPSVSVACAITEWNFDKLAEFAGLFRKLPLNQLIFMHTNFTTDEMADVHNAVYGSYYHATPSNMKELHLDKMDIEILQSEILKLKSMEYPYSIHFSPDLTNLNQLDVFYFHPGEKIGKRCVNAFDSITIKSDGSAMPAHTRCYQVHAGNIYQNTLDEIWNSTAIVKFRKTLSEAGGLLPACSRCCSAF